MKPGYSEPCNIWILPILEPGNRKSAVERDAAAALRQYEREEAERIALLIPGMRSEAEVASARAAEMRQKAAKTDNDAEAKELAHRAADIERNAPEVPKPPVLWASDATPERLGVMLAENGERMAWISAEAGFFDTIGGRYANGIPNLDLMLKAHSGDPERVERGSREPVYLKEPLLTIAMSPQPAVLQGLRSTKGFRGRGLLARFLYFMPPSPLGYRTLMGPPVADKTEEAYHRGVRRILETPDAASIDGAGSLHAMQLSPEASEEWQAYALHVETLMRPGSEFEDMRDWAGKAPGAVARVAGVLHVAEHAEDEPWQVPISRETMERACEIVSVSAKHTAAVFDLMGAPDGLAPARRLLAWIRRNGLDRFTARDAWQGVRGQTRTFPNMAAVNGALSELQDCGYVRVIVPAHEGPGRPASPSIVVRPGVLP